MAFILLCFGMLFSTGSAFAVLIPSSGSNSIACGASQALCTHAGCGAGYANSVSGFTVLTGGGSATINISGSYNTESGWDFIRIYAGSGTGGALVFGPVSGSGTINYTGAPGQTLTIQFTSDGSITSTGLNANVTYSGPCGGASTLIPASGSNTVACGTNTTLCSHAGCGVTYSNSVNGFTVLTGGGSATINVAGTYNTEANFDYVRIYNGSGTGGTLLATYTGSGTINYTGTAGQTLTVQFSSDGSITNTGLNANVTYSGSCGVVLPTVLVPASGNNSIACGTSSSLFDNGGSGGNYTNSNDGYTVLNNSNTGVITLSGTFSGIETCCDRLWIYSGVGIGGTLLASYNGTGSIVNVVSAPGQAITVRFTSDGSVVGAGFALNAVYSGTCVAPLPSVLVPFSGSNSIACGTNSSLCSHAGCGVTYANNANGFTVLNSQGTAVVAIAGTYSVESCCDRINIYNGSGTGGTLLAQFGSLGSGAFNYTALPGQTITVQFTSDFSVTNTGFTSTVTYTGSCAIPAPTVTSFTPTSACPGSTITINGTNFTGATAVSFGGVAASSFSVVSATQITAVLGSGNSGAISVTTPGGTASLGGFTATPPPTANAGPDVAICAGQSVQLNGSGSGTTFSWSPTTGLSNPNIANPVATPTSTTTYTLTSSTGGGGSSQIIYSQPFVQSVAPTTAATAWCTFRSQLLNTNTYSTLTVRGSNNTVGVSITNPVSVAAIANALNTATNLTIVDGANTWNVTTGCLASASPCSGSPGVVLSVNTTSCNCDGAASNVYVVRPEINNENWGGINTVTCTAPSQTMEVVFGIAGGGCSASDQVVVTVNPQPTANAGADLVSCGGAPVTLNGAATNFTSVSWSPTTGLSNPNILNPVVTTTTTTTYTLTANGTGCSASDQVVVTASPNPIANAGPDVTICEGQSTTLNGSGIGFSSVSWSPSTGLSNASILNPVATPSATTTYTLTTMASGGGSAQIIYSQPFVQFVSPTTAAAAWCTFRSQLLSTNTYSSLTVRGSVNPVGITLNDPVAVTAIANALNTASNYSFTDVGGNVWNVTPGCVSGNSPCSGSPGVVLSVNTSSCNCDGAASNIYVVRPEINNENWGGINTATCTAPSQTMEVIFNTNSGCSATDQMVVTVVPLPVVSAGADVSVCTGQTTTLAGTASGATNFVWSPSTGLNNATILNPVATVAGTTTYTLTGTIAPGCSSSDDVLVTALPLPDASFTGLASNYCTTAGPATLTPVTPGGTFSGAGVVGNTFVPTTGAGTYNVTYTLPSVSGSGYTYSAVPFAPLSSAGNSVSLSDDAMSAALPIGFGFNFYGQNYTSFEISSNGFITFNLGTFQNGCCTGGLLPQPFGPTNLIAAAWEDLYPPGGGTITYNTIGAPGSRICVISWDVPHYFGSYGYFNVTTQIQLYEGSNIIQIHTTQMNSDGGFHTQGIQDNGGTQALTTPGRNSADWTVFNDGVQFAPGNSSCGNSSTQTTVVAPCAPVAVCQNITVNADGNCQGNASASQFDGGSTDPNGSPLTFSVSPAGPYALGTTAVVLTVTNGFSLSSTCNASVTVIDNTPPAITCPANVSVNNTPGLCSGVATYATPVGTDNCGGAVTTQTAGLASGATYPVGVTTNAFSVTAVGGSSSCSFTVTVVDNEAPAITCPANVSVNNTPGLCSGVATYTAPVGTDNCAGAVTTQTVGLASGATYPVGVTTNTFSVTAVGGTSACSFTVTVVDNQLPVITCPASQTTCTAQGSVTAVMTFSAATATDNCPGVGVAQTAGLPSGSAFPAGVNTITYRATDASGNTASCSFTLTVNVFNAGNLVFTENMGNTSGTPSIAAHESANGFQNIPYTMSGTGDVRSTTTSLGAYTGASGGANVFLTNAVGGRTFEISGINTTAFAGLTIPTAPTRAPTPPMEPTSSFP